MRLPKYRRHSSGRGFVEHGGKRHYLPGPFNSHESTSAYKAFVRNVCGATVNDASASSVGAVISRFLQWAETYYPGRGTYGNLQAAVMPLVELYASLRPEHFGPKALKQWQLHLAARKKSRAYINDTTRRIKQMFKWAASEEMIPVTVYQALATVPGLKRDRTEATEPAPRTMVPWSVVRATLPYLSRTIRVMVRLQWLTGARSKSICLAKSDQFDIADEPWEWQPRHKGEYRGATLRLFLGPRARRLLRPILANAKRGDYLFRPTLARRNKRYGAFYTSQSYRQAVERGIERANAERKPDDQLPNWTPHQIRHAKATLIRAKYGLEGAQAAIGHESLDATQVYAARRSEDAKRIAEAEG